MKKSFLLLAWMVILCGCTKENLSDHESQPIVPLQSKSRFLSLDSIQQLAAELPEIFGDDPKTRSGYKKVVNDLVPLSRFMPSATTKSGTNDAKVTENIYVVNYAYDEGFAILSADTAMETVLAYSDQGNITDSMDNLGVRMFMEMIPAYADRQLSRAASDEDSLTGSDRYPAQSELFLRYEYSQVGPYIPVRWGQWSPFNDALPFKDIEIFQPCPDSPNGNPPAGCVAIAMLNIMVANRHPSSFLGSNGWYSCNWDTWRTFRYGGNFAQSAYDELAVSKLVQAIGSAVDMKYGCKSSSSTTKKANDAFSRFQYTTGGVYSFHIDRVLADLNDGRPIYVGGYATDNWIGHSDGHDWVIDGYKNTYKIMGIYNNFYDENNNLIRQEYFTERGELETRWLHCNYGWHGSGNGYYYVGVFNTEFPQELDADCKRPDRFRHYRFKLEVIKNIRPN